MLVLTRKIGEKIYIGQNREVIMTVLNVGEYGAVSVKLGFDAEKSIPIYREEIYNNNHKKEVKHGNK